MSDNIVTVSGFIVSELERTLSAISSHLDRDVITINAPMFEGVDLLIRNHVERLRAATDSRRKLAVIIETDGGSIETVERIADLLRHHYPDDIAFYVPGYAMSAGTVLVMSGDSIHMDYFSVLGPIDPQVRRANGSYVPALGYLEKYADFVARSAVNKLTDAEMALLINNFDLGELHFFEQARELSVELLHRWLVRYMFSNWTTTEGGRKTVTKKMREDRATKIANKLNAVGRWKMHGRGLSMTVLQAELDLVIHDFATDGVLNPLIRGYHGLLQDYISTFRKHVVVHTRGHFEGREDVR